MESRTPPPLSADPHGHRPVRTAARRGGFLEVNLGVPRPGHWVRPLVDGRRAFVKLLYCRPSTTHPGQVDRLFEVVTDPARAPTLATYLRDQVPRAVLSPTPGVVGRWIVSVREPADRRCRSTFAMGGYCLSCPLTSPELEGDEVSWSVLMPTRLGRRSSATRLRSASPRSRPAAWMKGIRDYGGRPHLTARQELALATAVHRGYFEVPRRAGLAEVADALGLRRSTVSEHLRKGIARLAAHATSSREGLPFTG